MQRDLERVEGRSIGGRFTVEEVLGENASGAIYRARDVRTGDRLAVKRVTGRDPIEIQRQRSVLEREYHLRAELLHPQLVEVYEFGVDEGSAYYTMELLPTALPAGKLDWREACGILIDVASSLGVLHVRGLLHGNVSRANVRCTADGRVKLMDVGSIRGCGSRSTPMGVAPYMAPEVCFLQELDARADLFALGALGYSLLTGRDAFPAREIEGLRDAWRSAVVAPSRLVSGELPAALDRCILRLLSLDRGSRPSCIGELLAELHAIVGLPCGERPEFSRGFMGAPPLTGRNVELSTVRKHVLALLGGAGSSLLIEGAAGTGRSRLLDACVFEAKLLGATVLRVAAADLCIGDWAMARALCLQLLPELATQLKGFSRHVLGRVIASLHSGEGDTSALASLERDVVLRELRDFLLTLSRGQRLVIAIDDLDRVDEPSAALLALVGQRTDEHGILLVGTVERPQANESDAPPSNAASALRLLRATSACVTLEPLTSQATFELVDSLLGKSQGSVRTAKSLYARCQGNVRATLLMLQSLLERRIVRHERGQWLLPSSEAGFPQNLAEVLAGRLAALSPSGLQLALTLFVARGEAIGLSEVGVLTGQPDRAQLLRSLEELVCSHVLVVEADRYRIAHGAFTPLLAELLSTPVRRAVHGKLAELLDRPGADVYRRAHHLFEAGREAEAFELLAHGVGPGTSAELPFLERALEAAERQSMPDALLYRLRRATLSRAMALLQLQTFRRVLLPQLATLEALSGLAQFRESPIQDTVARRTGAIAQVEQPRAESEGYCSPSQALGEFERLYVDTCWVALQIYDPELIGLLPALEPVLDFAPQIKVLAGVMDGARHSLHGRVTPAIECYERALQVCSEIPEAADEDAHRALRMGVRHHLGTLHAGLGSRAAEPHARILEAQREYRDAAFRVRARLHLSQGNVDEARKWQRRYELLKLQRGSQSCDSAGDEGFELLACAFSGDLEGLQRALGSVRELAQRHPGWNSAWCLGECHGRWLQGDLQGALAALTPALERGLSGKHPHYGYCVATHVVLLCEQDNAREAVARGREYERILHKAQVAASDRWLRQAMAYALGRSGKYEAAVAMIGQVIDLLEGLGVSGLPLGSAHEIRAKIAVYAQDLAAYERAAQRCSEAYLETCNPAMIGKLEQLAQESAHLRAQAVEVP